MREKKEQQIKTHEKEKKKENKKKGEKKREQKRTTHEKLAKTGEKKRPNTCLIWDPLLFQKSVLGAQKHIKLKRKGWGEMKKEKKKNTKTANNKKTNEKQKKRQKNNDEKQIE